MTRSQQARMGQVVAGLALVGLVWLGPAAARADSFMLVPEAPGQSGNANFKGYSELLNVGFNVATNQQLTACSVIVAKVIDSATPLLLGIAAQGKVIKEVTIVTTADRNTPLLEIRLLDATLGSISSATQTEGLPIESLSWTARLIKTTYTILNNGGKPAGVVEESVACTN